MYSLHYAPVILTSYPETSPYGMKPRPPNIAPLPEPVYFRVDDEFCAAARAQTVANGWRNPLRRLYGDNPYELYDDTAAYTSPPLPNRPQCPVLPHATPLLGSLRFFEQVDKTGDMLFFKATCDTKNYMVQVFRGNQQQEYERECHAYGHFLHSRIHEPKFEAVLRCHGWLELSQADIDSLFALPGVIGVSRADYPVKALIFDYHRQANFVYTTDISVEISDNALRGLCAVHSTFIVHGAVCAPNVVLRIGAGQAVWVNFGRSGCAKQAELGRKDFLRELAHAWDQFFILRIPDRIIRFDRDAD